MMATSFLREERTAAEAFVKHWEALCSAFAFPLEVPAPARGALVEGVTHVYRRRSLDAVPVNRIDFGSVATYFVSEWLAACQAMRDEVRMTREGRWLLAGNLLVPISLTGVEPDDPVKVLEVVAGPRVSPYRLNWYSARTGN